MKIDTINLIRGILEKRFRKLDKQSKAAARALDRAYGELEKAEESPDGGQAEIESAKQLVETCKTEKERAFEKFYAVRNALLDFESHNWH